MSFEEHCVHCEHYHNSGVCCYCKKEFTQLSKTPEEHRQEVQDILDEENSIDI